MLRRTATTLHRRRICLERLEAREVFDGAPVAVNDHFSVSEDAVLTANVLTGAGADQGERLSVTQVNGQAVAIGQGIVLPSGATITMQADGTFTYDPSTSATLGALPAGTSGRDSFNYTVTEGFREIYVFGDSLSDVGRLYAGTGGMLPPSPAYYDGRFSNGPIWAEYLAPDLNLDINLFNDFAMGGATTGTANVNEVRFNIPDLPGLQDEINSYVAQVQGTGADPDAIYVVWAGANDFFLPFDSHEALIGNAITNIATAVGTLQAYGAQHILVPNLPNLGRTPYALLAGQDAALTQLSAAFNDTLEQTLGAYFPSVMTFDVFSALNAAGDDAAALGVPITTLPYINDVTGVISAGNPSDYFFWDTVHPSSTVHAYLAEQMFARLVEVSALRHATIGEVTISINDVTTPPVLHVSESQVPDDTGLVRWHLSATDASPGDHSGPFTYVVHWGDGSSVEVESTAIGVTVEHRFAQQSQSLASFVVRDRDGDASTTQTRLVAVGSQQADKLTFAEIRSHQLAARISGQPAQRWNVAEVDAIVALGLGGRDHLFASQVSLPVEFFGGEGNDNLRGGRGNDLLVGNVGNDLLYGGSGDDLLIGGPGHDRIFGQDGDDTMLGGDGHDRLVGGPGQDDLLPNDERDYFVYASIIDQLLNRLREPLAKATK